MLTPGTILQQRYRIEQVLGRGGMGAVYLATEILLGSKRVAIKEMAIEASDPLQRHQCVVQFQSEARLLASLDHPGLVDVTHYFEENDHQYLVMAYIEGKTLETLMNDTEGFLPTATVLEWADQMAAVLEYLHGCVPPVIFRDMKPSNVMVDLHHRVRLIDFGISRTLGSGHTATFIRGAGTEGFAPPEQYGRDGTDARADIYSFGATLYCLLTRSIPPSSIDILTGSGTLNDPRALNPSIPASVEAVLLTMLEARKENRYQSVSMVRQALRFAAQTPSVAAIPTEGFPPVPPAPTAAARAPWGVPETPIVPKVPPGTPLPGVSQAETDVRVVTPSQPLPPTAAAPVAARSGKPSYLRLLALAVGLSAIVKATWPHHSSAHPEVSPTRPAETTSTPGPVDEKTGDALNPMGAAKGCSDFFQALDDGRYGDVWRLLTPTSQDRIVQGVAKEQNSTDSEIRDMFNNNDPRVAAFWTSFRTTSNASWLNRNCTCNVVQTYPAGSDRAERADVRIYAPDNRTQGVVQMYPDASQGLWRVGWLESGPK